MLADLVHVGGEHPRRDRLPDGLHVLEGDRIALVRHGRRSDLLCGEGLGDLADLAPLQLPHVVREVGHHAERADAGVRKIGPALRRHDLRGHGSGMELQASKEAALERARIRGQEREGVVRADRAGELSRKAPRRQAQ